MDAPGLSDLFVAIFESSAALEALPVVRGYPRDLVPTRLPRVDLSVRRRRGAPPTASGACSSSTSASSSCWSSNT